MPEHYTQTGLHCKSVSSGECCLLFMWISYLRLLTVLQFATASAPDAILVGRLQRVDLIIGRLKTLWERHK